MLNAANITGETISCLWVDPVNTFSLIGVSASGRELKLWPGPLVSSGSHVSEPLKTRRAGFLWCHADQLEVGAAIIIGDVDGSRRCTWARISATSPG